MKNYIKTLFSSLFKPTDRGSKKIQWVDINKINIDSTPIRHKVLPQSLIAKIKDIHSIFKEVFSISLEKMIDNFKRDTHPEKEVWIWEAMAETYKSYTLEHPSTFEEKKRELFMLLLDGSGAPERPGGFKHFSKDEVLEIVSRLEKEYETISRNSE